MRTRALIFTFALVLASCSAPDDADRPILVGTTEARSSIDPATCYEYLCGYVLLPATHEGLTRLQAETLKPTPSLATAWERSADGLTWTFHLRKGVKFHDGSSFDAETMKWSLERVHAVMDGRGPGLTLFDTGDPPSRGIVDIQVPDPSTIAITLATPDASLPARLAMPVASAVSRKAYPAATRAPNTVMVGTGPMVSDGYSPDGTIALRPNSQWWGKSPSLTDVTVRTFDSTDELGEAVRTGSVDVAVRSFASDDNRTIAKDAGWNENTSPSTSIRFLALNTTRPPFDSPEVRRYLSQAMDRGAIRKDRTLGSPLNSLIPAPFVEEQPIPKVDRIQTPVNFDLWISPDHYGPADTRLAAGIKKSLESSGAFKVGVHTALWSEFRKDFSQGNYGAWLMGLFPDVPDADAYLSALVSSSATRALGVGPGYADLDGLIVIQRSASTDNDRQQILQQINQRLASDANYIPLLTESWSVISKPRIKVTMLQSQVLWLKDLQRT